MTIDFAVIGAGYGDEGKGLMTDYLTRTHKAKIVSRQNGGAQAGHTVQFNGKRHIFSHVSAGTFAGAHTYLSSEFLINFHRLEREMVELKSMGVNPVIYAHQNARVTTIFDVLINQMLERSRGDGRAGSCGMGINETIVRSELFYLSLSDCMRFTTLVHALWQIKNKWVVERMKTLGIFNEENLEVMDCIDVMELAYFYNRMARHHFNLPRERRWHAPVVFEGAQGLMIDAGFGVFPHVTPTMVGLIASLEAGVHELHSKQIQPVYVTRAYVTRHGAGPMAHFGEIITDAALHDLTNEPNEFQGTLKYAPLDIDVLVDVIGKDYQRAVDRNDEYAATRYGYVYIKQPVLAITCLDQLGSKVSVYNNSKLIEISSEYFIHAVDQMLKEKNLQLPIKYVSCGPSAETVKELF